MGLVRGKVEHPHLIVVDKISAWKWVARSDGIGGTIVYGSPPLTHRRPQHQLCIASEAQLQSALLLRYNKTPAKLDNQSARCCWGKPSIASMDGGGINEVDS